jgi:hypothetical protein
MKFSVLFIILIFSTSSFASELIFKLDDKVVLKLNDSDLKKGVLDIKGELVGSVDKTLFNAWRGYERTYRGYSFYELLNSVYGADWVKYKKITFTALDGYKQIARIKKMLSSAKGKAGYIAYTETGKKGFSKFKRKKKVVNPGPFYLVWSNFNEKDKASHGDHLKWPYQLKTINLKSK